MNTQRLNALLEQLHAELQALPELDSQQKVALQDLQQDIQATLNRTNSTPGLGQRIRESISLFEGSHPSLTLTLEQVIDTLSSLGI